jgi:hypothetical protein
MLVRISRRLPHHTQPHFKMADHLSLVTAFWSRASVGRSAKVTCHLREINMELPHRVQKGLWANPKCPNTGMNDQHWPTRPWGGKRGGVTCPACTRRLIETNSVPIR